MTLHIVELDGFIAPGEPCRDNVADAIKSRPLNISEIDEYTHTRSMRAVMTVSNNADLRFEMICEYHDIDKAKQMLAGLMNKETQIRYELHQRIAKFTDN